MPQPSKGQLSRATIEILKRDGRPTLRDIALTDSVLTLLQEGNDLEESDVNSCRIRIGRMLDAYAGLQARGERAAIQKVVDDFLYFYVESDKGFHPPGFKPEPRDAVVELADSADTQPDSDSADAEGGDT